MAFADAEGAIASVIPFVWMFNSTYESLRHHILAQCTLSSLVQLEYNAFEPACVPVCTFTLANKCIHNMKGTFVRLSDFRGHESQAPKTLEAITNPTCEWRFSFAA